MKLASVTLFIAMCSACAQSPPAFEVASIKPNHSGSGRSSTNGTKGQLRMENLSLKRLIQRAYDVRDFSLSGPDWLDTEHFDILAKPPEGAPPEKFTLMLQTLLTERFKLAVHREKKTMAGYALVVAKKGAKLEAAEETKSSSTNTSRGRLEARGVSMSTLADALAHQVDRPVEDLTGLTGSYNFKLEWTPDAAASEKSSDVALGPTLFTALQEQLGLQLRAQKVTIEVLVVDSAERVPTEN